MAKNIYLSTSHRIDRRVVGVTLNGDYYDRVVVVISPNKRLASSFSVLLFFTTPVYSGAALFDGVSAVFLPRQDRTDIAHKPIT